MFNSLRRTVWQNTIKLGKETRKLLWLLYSLPSISEVKTSSCSLSYDRSTASSKTSSSHRRSHAYSFNFLYSLFSLKSSSRCLRLLSRHPVTSKPRIFPWTMRVRCGQSRWLPSFLLLCVGNSSSHWLCVIVHFSHDRPNWSSPSFSSTTFQAFPGISDLLLKVSKFQHHKMLCSNCSTLLVSVLNLSPVW